MDRVPRMHIVTDVITIKKNFETIHSTLHYAKIAT